MLFRQLACVALGTIATIGLAVAPAHSQPPNGCPGGFYLFAVVPGLEFVDANADGLICGKDLPRSPFGGILLDNKPKA